jgi:hypothetical protein
MSALGQKRTLHHVRLMSALPPKADIGTWPASAPWPPQSLTTKHAAWPLDGPRRRKAASPLSGRRLDQPGQRCAYRLVEIGIGEAAVQLQPRNNPLNEEAALLSRHVVGGGPDGPKLRIAEGEHAVIGLGGAGAVNGPDMITAAAFPAAASPMRSIRPAGIRDRAGEARTSGLPCGHGADIKEAVNDVQNAILQATDFLGFLVSPQGFEPWTP